MVMVNKTDFLSNISPFSAQSKKAAEDFKYLPLTRKIAVVAAAFFGGLATTMFLFAGGVAAFQFAVKVLKERDDVVAEKIVQLINKKFDSDNGDYKDFGTGPVPEDFTGLGKVAYRGKILEGFFKNGELNGKGRVRCHGLSYIITSTGTGIFKDGNLHGKGKIINNDRTYLTGTFEFGELIEGKAKIKYDDDSVYEGELKNGIYHGKGKFEAAGGNVYEGDFQEGKRHGKGTMKYAAGDVYEGDFYEDKRQGKGTLRYANGDVYVGDFHEGKRTGMGELSVKDKFKYTGQFEDGHRHGEGTQTYPDGRIREGTWENDKLVGNS